jgi:hypothetical protein
MSIRITNLAIVEMAGYIVRAVAKDKTDEMIPFVIQNAFILVAPALFAASVYMTLGRIISSIQAQQLSSIRVKLLTKLFVIGDVISFAVQSGGATMMATSDDPKLGETIIVAGLFVQIVVFGIYIVTTAIFHYRVELKDQMSLPILVIIGRNSLLCFTSSAP